MDFTSTKVFDQNGVVSSEWAVEHQRYHVMTRVSNGIETHRNDLDYYEYISSAGEIDGYYYEKNIYPIDVTITDVTLGVGGISGEQSRYKNGVLVSQTPITSGNASSYGVKFKGGGDQSTANNPATLSASPAPADAKEDIQKPVVPATSGSTPSLSADDLLASDLASIRGRGLAFGNQIKKDAVAFADTAVGMTVAGGLYEAHQGETVFGGVPLTNGQRAMSATFAVLPVGGVIIGKLGGEIIEGAAKGALKHVDEVAPTGAAVTRAENVAQQGVSVLGRYQYLSKKGKKLWKNKQYTDLVILFEDHQDILTPKEKKRFEYAKKHS